MRKLYKKLLAYVPERLSWAYVSMVLAALSVFVLMGAYWCLWQVFFNLLVLKDFVLALRYSGLVILLLIARSLIVISATLASHYMGFRLETNFRKAGLEGLMNASFAFFDKNSSGFIRKTIDDNAGNTHKTVAHLIPDNVVAILTPLLMFIMTFYIDYRLGILLVVTTLIGIIQYIGMYSRPDLMEKFSQALEDMSSATVEYVRNMQVIKIFGLTVKYYKSLIESIINYKDYVYAYSVSSRMPYVSFQVLFNIYYAIAVPFAIIFISRGEGPMIILAKLAFFAVFAGVIFSSFMAIMFTSMDNFQARNAIETLEKLLTSMKEDEITHGDLASFSGYDIKFEKVSFKYDQTYVLEDFSMDLEEGRTYALVGPSGGGKSTIAKLASGFYKVDSGRIKIGGRDLSDYSEEALLKNIAFVFQQSKLFKASIYENVLIGDESASREEVMAALESAQCQPILDKFPGRENTVIGSKGVHLSGGEVQRIAIARAILKDASIIILDEASAATDPENEYEIQRAFSSLMEGKTVIMIAHRLSSIKSVDEILFIEDGKIAERGSHQELMELGGRYRDLQDLYERANEWRVEG